MPDPKCVDETEGTTTSKSGLRAILKLQKQASPDLSQSRTVFFVTVHVLHESVGAGGGFSEQTTDSADLSG